MSSNFMLRISGDQIANAIIGERFEHFMPEDACGY
jgi:hypothetical protein